MNSELYQEMLREYERRGLDGEVLLRWAAFRVSHGDVRDAAERFLLLLADVEYLARCRLSDRQAVSLALWKYDCSAASRESAVTRCS